METVPLEILLQIALYGIDVWCALLGVPVFGRASGGLYDVARRTFLRRVKSIEDEMNDYWFIVCRRTVNLLGSKTCAGTDSLIISKIRLFQSYDCGDGSDNEDDDTTVDFLNFTQMFNENEIYALFDYAADSVSGEESAKRTFQRLIAFDETHKKANTTKSQRIYCDKTQPLRTEKFVARWRERGDKWLIKLNYHSKDCIIAFSVSCWRGDSGYECKKKTTFISRDKRSEKLTMKL